MAAYTAIDDPGEYFQIVLFTGTGSSHAITGVGFSPSLVWMKGRSHTTSHNIVDSVRGVTKVLEANGDYAEQTNATSLTAFGADGFTLGTNAGFNGSARTYASWNWLESATSGVDIVSYTGNGTDDTDISHSLSAVPKLIIVKNRDQDNDSWQVYHGANTAAPETDYLILDTTAATADAADRWSDEAPTSSVFTLGDAVTVNTNTEAYIAYLFSEKQGFSKFGSYLGNGNADGTFVYLGFRPAWVMIKGTGGTTNWHIYDDQRLGYNVDNNSQRANLATADQTDDDIDLLSNGFKIRRNTSALATSGGDYIYAAFAKAPLVNSNGVPCNAK